MFDVERLTNHTNADDQTIYRDAEDIRRARESGDPLPRLEAYLLQHGVDPAELAAIRDRSTAKWPRRNRSGRGS